MSPAMPTNTEVQAQFDLANTLRQQGRFPEAASCYQRVLALKPDHAEAHNNLGIVLKKLGRLEEAAASYQRALALQPAFVLAHNNLANIFQEQGKLDQAVASYRQALHYNPNLAAVHLNLGSTLRALGQLLEATSCFRQVVRLEPRFAEGHVHLGSCLQEQGETEQAIVAYRQAIACNPGLAEAHSGLAAVIADQGKVDEAVDLLQRAVALKPSDRGRIALATCLPVVYQSLDDLQRWRGRLQSEINQLQRSQVAVDVTHQGADPLFFLAYQGQNDRDIQRQYASLFRAPAGEAASPRAGSKIRVGFISTFFRTHTIGHWMRGLVAQLSRDRFEVVVLSIGRYEDEIAAFFKDHCDRFAEVPRDLPAARRLLAEQHLDVLFYTDIGMEPVTYTLALTRLAPVQCVTLGHPVTTGIDTVDYFISTEALETGAPGEHYTEELVRLKSLPIYYYRPRLAAPLRSRSDFGLATEDHVYACLQSPFKFHPDFDDVLGGILRNDLQGKLILTRGLIPHWEQFLRQRFAATLPDVQGRIQFLPMMNYNDYLHLLALADVQLDPLHFGGGSTSYDGLAVGTPIVTMPSRLLRGRITFALFHQIQVMDCVAGSPQEYVTIACRLGKDVEFRSTVRRKILDAAGLLFENSAGIRELELFLEQAVKAAGRPGAGPPRC
jgi:predicted O-linked N-acetylglucosamine transferase (SPINDLY family)